LALLHQITNADKLLACISLGRSIMYAGTCMPTTVHSAKQHTKAYRLVRRFASPSSVVVASSPTYPKHTSYLTTAAIGRSPTCICVISVCESLSTPRMPWLLSECMSDNMHFQESCVRVCVWCCHL
jgi:hypothetical protein